MDTQMGGNREREYLEYLNNVQVVTTLTTHSLFPAITQTRD